MLTPIDKIEVDFGKPTDFSPPRTSDLLRSLVEEAAQAETDDGKEEVWDFDESLWKASLTPQEAQEYESLCEAEEAAREAYSPKSDAATSDRAQTYFKAAETTERFSREHGRHICFACSYYTIPYSPDECAACFKRKKAIRPYSIACRCYTNTLTKEDMELDEKERIWMAQHPKEARIIEEDRKRQAAERMVKRMEKDSNIVFLSYQDDPALYERRYRKYPELFANTKYPTYEDFKAAAEKFLASFFTSDKETQDNE